ncbi:MAG: potassium-transporting ATPase subunit F [Bacteroidota bacterium]|nr:MAG: potassium-transporting ATPase subunit F [Bacteroidota bacterium]
MKAFFLLSNLNPVMLNHSVGYLIGTLIALLILGYLLYSLVNPEKF